ncbi:MAG TPA: hypothetical protein VFR09_02535, partial [Alphaproteobacteria bacterium]|nr:hypothetical protein [Alphaproteobacteria bacterium]
MWILPSRMRPASILRFIDAWYKTGASTKLLLLVDADDPTLADYKRIELPPTWSLEVVTERRTLIQLYNDTFAKYPNEAWYGGISDDM